MPYADTKKRNEYARKWYARNKSKCRRWHVRYVKKNHRRYIGYQRRYSAANRKKALLRAKAWQRKHRKHRKQYLKTYCYKNRVSALCRVKQWKKNNPLKSKALAFVYQRRRRTQLKTSNPAAMRELALQAKTMEVYQCFYCKGVKSGVPHLDHRIPLARGGKHEPENIAFACPPCNLMKGTMTDAAFLNLLENRK